MRKWFFVQVDNWALHRSRPGRFLPRGTCEFRVGQGRFVYHLCSEWWVGIYLVGVSIRGAPGTPASSEIRRYGRPTVKKKTALSAAGGDARHLAKMETDYFADLMPLVEHCAIMRYDDGEAREPGWVTIKTLGAAWVVQVKDPDAGVSFQFVSESLDKALEGATLLLACDDAPWQPDAFLKARKKK